MDIFILQNRLICPLEVLEMSISLELAIERFKCGRSYHTQCGRSYHTQYDTRAVHLVVKS